MLTVLVSGFALYSLEHATRGLERQAAKVDAESAGLPVGVQVVARPWAEATVLAVMRAIEEAARNDPSFPHTPVTPRS